MTRHQVESQYTSVYIAAVLSNHYKLAFNWGLLECHPSVYTNLQVSSVYAKEEAIEYVEIFNLRNI